MASGEYSSDLVDVTVVLKHTTEKAWLVDDGTREVWVPRSQCELVKKGSVWELTLSERTAREKGLI